jgi:hypothetical protein
MRKAIVAVALAGAMFGGLALPMAAQDGIVIQNNGVDNTNSAAGASNVNISRAAGNSSSTNGAGVNNDAGMVVKEKNRNRKDREARNNNGGGDEIPADAVEAAPAEGDYQAYNEGGEWVDPAAAPQEMIAEPAAQPLDPNLPVKLPNTGAGPSGGLPLAWIAAAVSAAAGAGAGLRRRLLG